MRLLFALLCLALHALVLALVALVYAPSVHASPVAVSPVVAEVVSVGFAVVAVGGAVLLLFGALGAFQYVRAAMGVGSVSASPSASSPVGGSSVRGYESAGEYLEALASRLAAEDARQYDRATGEVSLSSWDDDGRYVDRPVALGVAGDPGDLSPTYREATPEESASWDRINQRHDEAGASGSDMVLYGKYLDDGATHEEAMRWSNTDSNAEIKMPSLGSGWSTGEIKMPVLGPGWK